MVSQATHADWLALTVEAPLEPDLPICDPHHHLWDRRPTRVAPRYLLDEILADVQSGHNVVSTVFIECAPMFNVDGPEAMRPVGETEFVNGIAARIRAQRARPLAGSGCLLGRAHHCALTLWSCHLVEAQQGVAYSPR
jgi:hypothetical protein